MQHINLKRGLTLMELVVVLAVMGLLSSMALQGVALIRQSQAVQIYSQIQNLSAAQLSFFQAFQQIPGDMDGLTAAGIWTKTEFDTVCPLISGTNNKVHGGNGNHTIEPCVKTDSTSMASWAEKDNLEVSECLLATCHLTLSQITKTPMPVHIYKGLGTQESSGHQTDYANHNTHKAALKQHLMFTGIGITVFGEFTAEGNSNQFNIGSFKGSLKGVYAKHLDVKFDDGSPSSGTIRGYSTHTGSELACCTSSQDITQAIGSTNTVVQCHGDNSVYNTKSTHCILGYNDVLGINYDILNK